MKEKIKEFLAHAGYDAATGDAVGMHLLRYFEEEYGVSLMGLIEQEWLEEQMAQDLGDIDFQSLRDAVDERDLPALDRDLATLFGR